MVEINVIEMQKGENPGIGAAGFQELLQIDALEVFAHQAWGQAACPLVKISGYNFGTADFSMLQNVRAHQFPGLVPSFNKPGSQVHIEEMNGILLI